MALTTPDQSTWTPVDTGGVLAEAPADSVADGIFIYPSVESSTGFVRRVIDGTYRASWAGIFTGGVSATNTSRLNSVLAHPSVKEVVFDTPEGGDIPLSGTIAAAGKLLTFARGAAFSGVYTLTNPTISADDNQVIFKGTPTITGALSSSGKFSDIWFNVPTDGTTDATPALNTAIGVVNSSVQKTLKLVGAGVRSIAGTFSIPTFGILLEMDRGAQFGGDGTITCPSGLPALISSPQQQIFGVNLTIQNLRLSNDVRWNILYWGADNTGAPGSDSSPAINKAIQFLLKNPNAQNRLYFPRGQYNLSSSIAIYKWSGTAYQQTTITIEGEVNEMTGISFVTFKDNTALNNDPTLWYQQGRSIKIKYINFEGNFTTPESFTRLDVVRNTLSAWTQVGIRDTQYSPKCGINIDPFSVTVPSDGGYPGWNSFYRGVNAAGSSQCEIIGCRFSNYPVGMAVSINGYTQNAEMINVDSCSFAFNKVAYAVGQDQTKENLFNNCRIWERIHTIIDCTNYGAGIGCPPYVNGMNVAAGDYAIYQIINMEEGRHGFYAHQIFAESLFKIGVLKPMDFVPNHSSTFSECDFHFIAPDYGVPSADFLIQGKASFFGCSFKIIGNITNYRPKLSNRQCNVSFYGGTIQIPLQSVPQTTAPTYNLVEDGANFTDCSVIGYPTNSNFNKKYHTNQIGLLQGVPIGTTTVGWADNANVRHEFRYNQNSSDNLIALESAVVTVNNDGSGSVTLSAGSIALLRVNDYLVSDKTAAYSIIQNPTYGTPGSAFIDVNPVLGKITAIVGTTVTLSGVGVNVPVGTTASIPVYVNYIRFINNPISCTITNGSPTLTAVEYCPTTLGTISPPADMRIEHPAFPVGTYVVSVNTGAGTITLSQNATYGEANASIINGSPEIFTFSNNSPDEARLFYSGSTIVSFFAGAKWRKRVQANATSTDKFLYYYITINSFSNSSAHPYQYMVDTTGLDVDTIANIKFRYSPIANQTYAVTDANKQGLFYYDASDTTTAGDDVNVIVGSYNNNRFKRWGVNTIKANITTNTTVTIPVGADVFSISIASATTQAGVLIGSTPGGSEYGSIAFTGPGSGIIGAVERGDGTKTISFTTISGTITYRINYIFS